MKTFDIAIDLLGAVSAVVAAVLFLKAAFIEVPDNIDTMIGEFQRIAQWTAYGCMAAFVGAFLGAIAFARKAWRDCQ